MKKADVSNLKTLGALGTQYSNTYDPKLLESFDLPYTDQKTKIELECPEFTSLCPKTGQPDFANITITYSPNIKCVESKSLKLYLFSFRNEGSFHETCVNTIARDLFDLLSPQWIQVRGDFYPRGGISINPVVYLSEG